MPLYEYTCKDCGRGHEQLHGIKDNPDPTCPFCDSPRISKRVSPATFILKGEGWFRDGYSSKKPSSSGSS